jgi:hypothetical protein
MSAEGEDMHDDGSGEDRRHWYQRPWLASYDGFNWSPTSWGALIAIAVLVVLGVVAIDWINALI